MKENLLILLALDAIQHEFGVNYGVIPEDKWDIIDEKVVKLYGEDVLDAHTEAMEDIQKLLNKYLNKVVNEVG